VALGEERGRFLGKFFVFPDKESEKKIFWGKQKVFLLFFSLKPEKTGSWETHLFL